MLGTVRNRSRLGALQSLRRHDLSNCSHASKEALRSQAPRRARPLVLLALLYFRQGISTLWLVLRGPHTRASLALRPLRAGSDVGQMALLQCRKA